MVTAIITGAIGITLGVILTTLSNLLLGYKSSRKRAEYLAIRVSFILDRYVDGCVAVVQDDGLFQGQAIPNGIREIRVPAPKLEIQKIDVDWKSLSSDFMYEILSFPNKIEESNQTIDFIATEEAIPPDFEEAFEERQYQYSKLGYQAAQIGSDLRQKYKIPHRNYGSWNPVEFLKNRKTEIENARKKRQENFKSPMEIMNSKQPETKT